MNRTDFLKTFSLATGVLMSGATFSKPAPEYPIDPVEVERVVRRFNLPGVRVMYYKYRKSDHCLLQTIPLYPEKMCEVQEPNTHYFRNIDHLKAFLNVIKEQYSDTKIYSNSIRNILEVHMQHNPDLMFTVKRSLCDHQGRHFIYMDMALDDISISLENPVYSRWDDIAFTANRTKPYKFT